MARIGRLMVGGGTLALAALPVGAADRARIENLHPDLVLSLTTDHEMEDHAAGDLGAWFGMRGLDWLHHPVADFGHPADAPAWSRLEARLIAVLARGGRVVVHCRAGLGRSGAVALRLMCRAGEDPGAALARLRAARPGAVETEAQRTWAVTPPG